MITVKGGIGTTLDEKTMAFTTAIYTDVDALQADHVPHKLLRNGLVLIERNGKNLRPPRRGSEVTDICPTNIPSRQGTIPALMVLRHSEKSLYADFWSILSRFRRSRCSVLGGIPPHMQLAG